MCKSESNENVVKFFREKMVREMRTYKWFHRTYLKAKGFKYGYFIVMINDPDKLQKDVKKSIEKYINAWV